MRALVHVLNTHMKSQTPWRAPVTPGSRNFGVLGAYWLNNPAKMASSMFNKKIKNLSQKKKKLLRKTFNINFQSHMYIPHLHPFTKSMRQFSERS